MQVTRWNEMVGLFAVTWREEWEEVCLQFFIRPSGWTWGFEASYYDGALLTFGLGPIFTVTWPPRWRWVYRFTMKRAGMAEL